MKITKEQAKALANWYGQNWEEVFSAMQAADEGNNGHAEVPRLSGDAIRTLRAIGYSVVPSSRVHANGHAVALPGIKLYGPAASAPENLPLPDYEAGILAKQSLAHLY